MHAKLFAERSRRIALCASLLALSIVTAAPSRAQDCTGDCNGNQRVEVNELVIGVHLALGDGSGTEACPALSASPSIDELVVAVSYSIAGCPDVTPLPTRTPTPMGTGPTATPTTGASGRCGNGVVEFPPLVPVGETCDPPDGPAAEERPEQPGDTCSADCQISECNAVNLFPVDVRITAPAEAVLANLTVWVRYPDGDIGIRGRGLNVLDELGNLPPDAAVTPNDVDFALRALFIDTAEVGLPFDPLFTIGFQLCATSPPTAEAFRCVVETATDYTLGDVTDQTSCTVVVPLP